MNDVTKRFINTYKSMGLTGYKIGKQSKVITKQKISNIESGITEASLDIISDFCNTYHNVNVEYIIRGKGSPLKTTESSPTYQIETKNINIDLQEEQIDSKRTIEVLIKVIETYQIRTDEQLNIIEMLKNENADLKEQLQKQKAS